MKLPAAFGGVLVLSVVSIAFIGVPIIALLAMLGVSVAAVLLVTWLLLQGDGGGVPGILLCLVAAPAVLAADTYCGMAVANHILWEMRRWSGYEGFPWMPVAIGQSVAFALLVLGFRIRSGRPTWSAVLPSALLCGIPLGSWAIVLIVKPPLSA